MPGPSCGGSIGAALLFLPALAAHAQEPVSAEGTTRTVAGRVVADETGEPLENVLVELVVQGLHALTDSRGRFRIEGAEPVLDTLVASYFAISETRRALDLSRSGTDRLPRVELRLAGTPPASPEEPEETLEAPAESDEEASDHLLHLVRGCAATTPIARWRYFPGWGSPDADLGALSETERARGAGDLITVLGVGERQGIRLRATWPILLLFGSRVTEDGQRGPGPPLRRLDHAGGAGDQENAGSALSDLVRRVAGVAARGRGETKPRSPVST